MDVFKWMIFYSCKCCLYSSLLFPNWTGIKVHFRHAFIRHATSRENRGNEVVTWLSLSDTVQLRLLKLNWLFFKLNHGYANHVLTGNKDSGGSRGEAWGARAPLFLETNWGPKLFLGGPPLTDLALVEMYIYTQQYEFFLGIIISS